MPAETSILKTVKSLLGLLPDETAFDPELILLTNSALSTITQLGVGPQAGFKINSATEQWSDLLSTHEKLYENVKQLVFLKVKMVFDPPTLGYMISAYEKLIDEETWRISMMREDIDHPPPPKEQDVRDDLFGEPVAIDGGDIDDMA